DLVALSASFYAFYIPFSIVVDHHTSPTLFTIYWLIIGVFIGDIIVNLIRSRPPADPYMISKHHTSMEYIKGWLFVDILSAVPFFLFNIPEIFGLIQLVKLFRIVTYMHEIRQIEVRLSSPASLLFFIFWIIHIIHWLSCGWIYLTMSDEGIANVGDTYLRALYWVVTTLTTVGYGDITPETNKQMIYSMMVELTGFGVFGYLIGNIASILSKKDPSKQQFLNNIDK
ncbi:MAG: ion transporter, partial [Bacteroidetes bacterium]|nr:ion transporter [Bacteroidota bacterium]